MIVKFEIYPTEAYSAKDIDGRLMTVGELRAVLEDYEDDTQIVTVDLSNYRGAKWGRLVDVEDLEEDDDEVDCE